jgi:rod shape determining protein RodA
MLAEPIQSRSSQADWLQLAALGVLMLLGAAFIYSATRGSEALSALPWHGQPWARQLAWYGLGLAGLVAVSVTDYHRLARWATVAYGATLLLLVLVLVAGDRVYGARRWFDLGLFKLQPSEFAKLTLILALGQFLSRPVEELRQPHRFYKALGLMGVPFVLILREPDLGSALILIPIGLVMLFVAGVPGKYLWRLIGGATVLVGLILVDVLWAPPNWQIRLEEYQRRRLLVYFGRDFAPPNADPVTRAEARRLQRDFSYNVEQALISVGSGGLWGKGWCQGTQNALGYLPRTVAHNDFIFSVIAEEKGFLGSVLVVALYSVVLFTGIRIAGQARDRLGRLLAAGVVALFFSHVFINIGMNIRLMPVTGVPLPLLSYGGSSVLVSLIAAGIMQSVYLHRR